MDHLENTQAMKPTPEQIAKLPKWAQDYIVNLSRERESAINSLNAFCDSETQSPFYVEESVCTGEQSGPTRKRHYIQAHAINVEWAGVHLRVDANDYGNRRSEIGLSYGTGTHSDVALIPYSYCQATLKTKENMR